MKIEIETKSVSKKEAKRILNELFDKFKYIRSSETIPFLTIKQKDYSLFI